jgi:hypothetical protein
MAAFGAALVITLLICGAGMCAAPQSPVEITGINLAWVGVESSIRPDEKGERSFRQGGKPPTLNSHDMSDRFQEGAFSGNWAKMDVEFTTYRDWEDQIEFNFYLLLKDKDGFKMLKGVTTVIYVARGKKHYAVMYGYPNAIARYGGDVQAMAVEAVVNGKVVSFHAEPKVREQWWKEHTPIGGAIVDWIYTPMKRSGVEAYELIRIGR